MNTSKHTYLAFLFFLLVINACTDEGDPGPASLDKKLEKKLKDHGGKSAFIQPRSFDYDKIPQDPNNKLTKPKVDLGAKLFHESALGNNPRLQIGLHTYSCASCHHASGGFQANLSQGLGEGGIGFGLTGELRKRSNKYYNDSIDVQPIRSPSILGIAYQEVVLWNGALGSTGVNTSTQHLWPVGTPVENNFLGYQGTETQAIAGLTVHRMDINEAWARNFDYVVLFEKAFPSVPIAEVFTKEYAGLAIAAYERTLLPNNSGWQKWLNGDEAAMTARQKDGAILFFGKAECVSCHSGPSLSDGKFYALGMKDIPGTSAGEPTNNGRGGFTQNPDEMNAFKTPQLYNLKDSPFYGHGSSFSSINEVIKYHLGKTPENPNVDYRQLANYFTDPPIKLKNKELEAITDFIENGLYDPSLDRYVPDNVNSGMCFPVNDQASRRDLGCS